MASGQVTLRGRFRAGTVVSLVQVAGEHVLRSEGGKEVDRKKVDDDGCVQFTGLDIDGRYFAEGLADGHPLSVRLRARAADDDAGLLAQAPIGYERSRVGVGGTGGFADEPAPADDVRFEAAPDLAQSQVDGKTVQRSSTVRGSAHPHDPEEQVPHPRQEDVKKGTVQMSDTKTGQAAPQAVGPQRQEDVSKGAWQRSSTPTGVATLLPSGGPVDAQREKESSEAKAKRGDPGKAAASPLHADKPVTGATGKESEARQAQLRKSEKEATTPAEVVPRPEGVAGAGVNTSGLDAQGQPAYPDAAKAAGVEPASKPAEPVRQPLRSVKGGKKASSAKRPARKSKSTTANKKEK